MVGKADLPEHAFDDADALDAWLREHHATIDAIWMRIAKQGGDHSSVSWKEAVPVLLCWGWIDGQARSIDEHWYAVRVGQRRPRSIWSKINVAHVERLTAEGRMQPAGLAQVEAAKVDGRWEAAYSSVASKEVPPELQAALDASPRAAAAFAALKSAERYAMTFRVHSVKRDETKQRHVARFIAELEGRDTNA